MEEGDEDSSKPNNRYKGIAVLLSRRWRFTLLLFSMNILLYMHRVNLSLAVVCMTKDPTDQEQFTDFEQNHARTHSINGTGNTTVVYHVITGSSSEAANRSNNTVTEPTLPKDNDQCSVLGLQKNKKEIIPELNWEKTQVSFLLSSYFYGSFFSQVPGGRFADRFGGKHVITATMVLTTVCSMLTPICARTSIILMFVVRILVGLAGGAVIPAGICMLSAWAPPNERSVMIAFSAAGFSVGTILSYQTSGLLCVYGFDNGWPSIFYLQGALTAVITTIWCLEVSSTPASHKGISTHEREYIQSKITHSTKKASNAIPWKAIFTSRPMWGSIIAHFGYNWSFFTVLITVPLFLKEVLKFDVKENGFFSSLPYICNMTFVVISGKLSAFLIRKRILGHLFTRRAFTLVSMAGFGACLVFAGYLTCELRHVSVLLLCMSCVFSGLIFGGFITNHAEFSGQFSGTVFGITNAGGVISALLASLSAGLLTPNGTQAEWQVVFYIAAAIDIVCALAFVTCSSVTLEPWARKGLEGLNQRNDQEIEVLKPEQENEYST